MKMLWCWGCKKEVPMLDEREWAEIWHGCESLRGDRRQIVLGRYNRLTGYNESHFNNVFLHRISIHGPPCAACGKVLRTPAAYKCFECGHIAHAPNWTFLFNVASSQKIAARGSVLTSDACQMNDGLRLRAGDHVEVWEGSRRVTRAPVLELHTVQGGKMTLVLPHEVPPIEPGYTVRYSPPREGDA